MTLEKEMLITLSDDKKYVVLDTILYKDIKYVYLVEYKNEMNIKAFLNGIDKENLYVNN